jgi:hypothetical protein
MAIAVLRFGLSKFLRPDDVITRLASLLAVFCHVLVLLSLFLLSSSSHLFSGRMLSPLAALCVTLIGFFLFHNFSSNSGPCIGAAAATPWAFSSAKQCTSHEKPWWASFFFGAW